MHVKSREEAAARYGHIDFASGYWPNQHKWIQLLEIPEGMFPLWHVLDSKLVVRHIACNVDIHAPLLTALHAVKDRGLEKHLKTFDGCFNIRAVRGSTRPSTHSYGLAVDINAATNPMGKILRTDMKPDFVKCFTEQGFSWGGAWRSIRDAMHYSYAWE